MNEKKQPTFKNRIELLEGVAQELAATTIEDFSIHEFDMFQRQAVIITNEVERMKLANQKWDLANARKKAKTASKETN